MNEPRDPLWDLLDAACDDALTPEQEAELDALLRANPEAQRLYLDHVQLRADVYLMMRARRTFDKAVAHIAPAEIPAEAPPVELPAARPTGIVAGALRASFGYLSHPVRFSLFFAAVTTLSALLFFGQIRLPGRAVEQPLARRPAAPTVNYVAQIGRVLQPVWASDDVQPELGSKLFRGEEVQLNHGLAELNFRSGARVLLQGPVRFQIASNDRLLLSAGRVNVQVPPSAHGFAVQTAAGTVVDLGTEFSVAVSTNDEGQSTTELLVSTGTVAIEGDFDAAASGTIISAGEACRFDSAGRMEWLDAGPLQTRFVRAWPRNEQLPLSPYAETVLADSPVAYYRFEDPSSAQFIIDIAAYLPGRNPHYNGRYHTYVPPQVELAQSGPRPPEFPQFAADNQASFFDGRRSFIRIKDPGDDSALDFDLGDTITLEAWVNLRELANDRNVYIIGKGRTQQRGTDPHNQNYALRLRGIDGTARVSFLFRNGEDQTRLPENFHRWNTDAGFPPGSGWHHVAVSYTFGEPESIRGYIDGQAVPGTWDMLGATTLRPVVDNSELWIGSSLGGNPGNTLHGAIDEVAIHRGALSPARLQARLARPAEDTDDAPTPEPSSTTHRSGPSTADPDAASRNPDPAG